MSHAGGEPLPTAALDLPEVDAEAVLVAPNWKLVWWRFKKHRLAMVSGVVVLCAPWLLLPGLAVIITVLALNILGDGLRDAADPYR